MFAFLAKPRASAPALAGATVACCGKLPLRAEFIKHRLAERELLALDQWMQEGYALLSRRAGGLDQKAFRAAPVQYAVLAGSAEERSVLAVITPSSDQSGRLYPFVLAALPASRDLRRHPSIIPLGYRDFYRQGAALVAQPWRHEPLSRLTGCIDALALHAGGFSAEAMLDTEVQQLQRPATELWASLPEVIPDERAPLMRLLMETLRQAVRRTALRTAWGLRLPLPRDPEQTWVLCFWLRLCQTVFAGATWRPSLFWHYGSAEHAPALTVFFRPPPAAYVPHLFDPALRDGTVLDLLAELRAAGVPEGGARLTQGSCLHLLQRVLYAGAQA